MLHRLLFCEWYLSWCFSALVKFLFWYKNVHCPTWTVKRLWRWWLHYFCLIGQSVSCFFSFNCVCHTSTGCPPLCPCFKYRGYSYPCWSAYHADQGHGWGCHPHNGNQGAKIELINFQYNQRVTRCSSSKHFCVQWKISREFTLIWLIHLISVGWNPVEWK